MGGAKKGTHFHIWKAGLGAEEVWALTANPPQTGKIVRPRAPSLKRSLNSVSAGDQQPAVASVGTRRRSPPEDGRSVDGTDSQLHKQASRYTSKRLEVLTRCNRAIADGV